MGPILPQICSLYRFLRKVQKEPHQTCSILSILGQKDLLHWEPCVFERFAAVLTSDAFVFFTRVNSWCPSFCKTQFLEILVASRLKSLSPCSSSFLLKLSVTLIIFTITVWMFASFNFDLKMWIHNLFCIRSLFIWWAFFFVKFFVLIFVPVKVWP